MKYVRLYAYLEHNLGDDLMVDLLLKRYPKCKFIFLDKWDGYSLIEENNGITMKTIWEKWGRINHLLNLITFGKDKDFFLRFAIDRLKKKAMCAVYIGGSLYMQNKEETVADRIEREQKKLEGHPLFVIGANFGPYYQKEFAKAFHNYFPKCQDVCFRDSASYDEFADLSNTRFAPDVVFNLPQKACKATTDNVIISVLNFRGRKGLDEFTYQYENFIVQICQECVSVHLTPVLVSFCKAEGDEEAAKGIADKLLPDVRCRTVLRFYSDINSAIQWFASAQFVIATRFHAMIIAARYGIPFYSVAYNSKISNVLEDMGCKDYCYPQDIGTVSVPAVLEKRKQKTDYYSYYNSAEKQFEKLDEYLK